jgi:hypothetical protein
MHSKLLLADKLIPQMRQLSLRELKTVSQIFLAFSIIKINICLLLILLLNKNILAAGNASRQIKRVF